MPDPISNALLERGLSGIVILMLAIALVTVFKLWISSQNARLAEKELVVNVLRDTADAIERNTDVVERMEGAAPSRPARGRRR